MSILPIYVYDHSILKHKADQVEQVHDEIRVFIEDMKQTMVQAEGIGLAANQVGSPLSIRLHALQDLLAI